MSTSNHHTDTLKVVVVVAIIIIIIILLRLSVPIISYNTLRMSAKILILLLYKDFL